MKTVARSFLGFLISACMLILLLPQPVLKVQAAGTGKAIQLVNAANPTGGIEDQHHVYFGRPTPDRNRFDGCWRVLDADETNTGDPGMFFLTEHLLYDPSSSNGDVCFNADQGKGSIWRYSDASKWCLLFYDGCLGREGGAIIKTYKSDDPFKLDQSAPIGYMSFSPRQEILNGDMVFFLSAEEACNASYGFAESFNREDRFGRKEWYLRSSWDSIRAGVVTADGYIAASPVDDLHAARPALNLDLSSVLFTSAAEGGKSSNGIGADALQEVPDYSGSEWKLTLKDSERSGFKVEAVTGDRSAVTVSYSGAVAKHSNDYISSIITDSTGNTIKYYGRIAVASDAAGASVTINLAGKLGEGDLLYVFNEELNDDKSPDSVGDLTDFASDLQLVSIPVPVNVSITAGANMAKKEGSGALSQTVYTGSAITGVSFTAGEGYYFPENYTVAAVNGITVTRDSEKQITVSGTPTADTALTLSDAQPVVLTGIKVSNLPSKTVYAEGESFDPTDMEVTATYSDKKTSVISSDKYTYSPAGALSTGDTSITVSYTEGGITKTAEQSIQVQAKPVTLESIAITVHPSKTEYTEGESFDPTDMEVTATYSDQNTAVISNDKYTYSPAGALSTGDTSITVSYTENGITKETTQAITVSKAPVTYKVSFDSNGGSGQMDDIPVGEGVELSLPACSFGAPENKEFDCWTIDGTDYTVNDPVTVNGDITVTATWKDKTEEKPEKKEEPASGPVYVHEHHYEWEITREATPTEDGEIAYVCSGCGSVTQRIPISGYISFNIDAAEQIRNAQQEGTVVIRTEKWISLYSIVWDELAKRPDVTLVIDFKDHGVMYEVVVPAGTDVETLKDENGYAGFLFLSGMFGRQKMQ